MLTALVGATEHNLSSPVLLTQDENTIIAPAKTGPEVQPHHVFKWAEHPLSYKTFAVLLAEIGNKFIV